MFVYFLHHYPYLQISFGMKFYTYLLNIIKGAVFSLEELQYINNVPLEFLSSVVVGHYSLFVL